jgi:transcription elongation GreA/GreB family factor
VFVIGSYMVLGDDETRISYESPMAKLLLGKAKGEARRNPHRPAKTGQTEREQHLRDRYHVMNQVRGMA